MPAPGKNRRIFINLAVVLLLAALGLYARTEWRIGEETRAASSLRAVSFWITEYGETHRTPPDDLEKLITHFTTLHPTDEFGGLLNAIDRGEVDYHPKPAPGKPMIRWRRERGIIDLSPEGSVRITRH